MERRVIVTSRNMFEGSFELSPAVSRQLEFSPVFWTWNMSRAPFTLVSPLSRLARSFISADYGFICNEMFLWCSSHCNLLCNILG